jgi:hypothetical protein
MKATTFLSACSIVLALMMVAPALAQEEGQVTREAQEEELLTEEAQEVEPQAVPFAVRRVAVECNGNCGDITLGQACGAGWTPFAVDCQNVQEQSSSFACGSPANNRCRITSLSTNNLLSSYCDNIDGWDANVYCAQAQ